MISKAFLPPVLSVLALLACAPRAAADVAPVSCREQVAQDFLIRGNMLKAKEGFAKAVDRAIRYRVEQYGHVPGARMSSLNPVSVRALLADTTFLGLPVTLNRRIVGAVACAEAEIVSKCGAFPYQPKHLSGIRTRNTYQGGEISNHMFGLALDVDPADNPCCGCVKPWSDNWKCKKRSTSPFDRAELPRCWVQAFEKFGFYWLGWDVMQDTMHFEFLGDPDKIF